MNSSVYNCNPRISLIIGISLLLSSCARYHTLEGRGKPVYLTADASVFKDTLNLLHPVHYRILADLGSAIETTELVEGETAKVIISRPTFFYSGVNEFLVYPGEHITVKEEAGHSTFIATNRNDQRNRELQFFKTLQELRKYPSSPSFVPATTLETVLAYERMQKDLFPKAEAEFRALFDSLITAYNVSKKFKKLASSYAKNALNARLNDIYVRYKDTLMAHGLYFEKLRQQIPAINGIKKKSDFNRNVKELLDEIMRAGLFPGVRMWSFDDAGFKAGFDSIENNFSGFARDYLLSRLMYGAYAKGSEVTSEYKKKYTIYSIDRTHKKIVKNTRRQRGRTNKDNNDAPDMMLAADGKSKLKLDELLSRYKGKFVLMDLWASWCHPCIKEMPYMQQLIEKYSKVKVVFLAVSLDRDAFSWRDAIYKQEILAWNNYLLLDAPKTSFYKKNGINEIPRYIIFDKEGKVMNANAPSPSEPALTVLLDKLTLE